MGKHNDGSKEREGTKREREREREGKRERKREGKRESDSTMCHFVIR
jgi:hypothetical protein